MSAAPREATSLAAVADAVNGMRAFRPESARLIVGLVGAPGAGKSTVAGELAALLDAVVVPMDGYHLPQRMLRERGLRERMGAPDTFDVDGFVALLERLRTRLGEEAGPGADADQGAEPVLAPAFDRAVEEPVPDAITVTPAHRTVIVEGNYLLTETDGWHRVRPLIDLAVGVVLDPATRRERLVARHVASGKTPEAAAAWVDGPDEANARLIAATLEHADLLLRR